MKVIRCERDIYASFPGDEKCDKEILGVIMLRKLGCNIDCYGLILRQVH